MNYTQSNPNHILGYADPEQAIPSTTYHTNSPSVPYIHNLPSELLAHILLLSFAGRYQDLFGMASITSLRQVCSRWNATILREPAFWTHINEDDALKYPLALENKVQRSGVLPLNIQYWSWQELSSSGEDPTEYTEFYSLLELISRHTQRWKSLSIYAFDDELDKIVECLDRQRFPELVELKIRRGSIGPYYPNWTLFGTPKLRTLRLAGRVMPWDFSDFPTLVTLEVEGAISRLDLLVEMIRKSRNIEELVLSVIEDDEESQNGILWPDETQVTTLSELKRIRITKFQFAQAVGCVLRCIHAPNIMDVFISEDRENQSHEGLVIVKALMVDSDMGRQSILTSMLCEASNMESLKLKGFRESLVLGLDDPVKDLYCKVIAEDEWEETLAVIEGVASYFGLPVRLHSGWQPVGLLAIVLSLFPSAKEFELVSSDTPLEDVLQLFSLLSHPLRKREGRARWVCRGLARFSLNGQRSEQELAVLRNNAEKLTQSRKDFNNEENQRHGGSDSDGCLEVVTVLLDGVEL